MEFGAAFIPDGYPFVPVQVIPGMRIAGRHGTLRWPGRTFGTRVLRGVLYLLERTGEAKAIDAREMMHRASDVAAWLCGRDGRDGRGRLVLDAMPDRYFMAEVSGEAQLADGDWANGCARIAFVCQPFARSVDAREIRAGMAANGAVIGELMADGNVETVLEFEIEGAISGARIEANGTQMAFENLGMAAGERLRARYTDDDILKLEIVGANGAVRSAMMARTMDSDDDVVIKPGRNEVTVTVSGAGNVLLSARGRWL